jgi:hypothetical protein
MSRMTNLEFPCGFRRLTNGNTLISDAGDAGGNGSKILEVSPDGEIEWSWERGLDFAHSIVQLEGESLLIADTTNNRILEVHRDGRTLLSSDSWSDGTGALSDGSHLHYPNNAVPTEEGDFMITDRNNDRFVVTDRTGEIVRVYDEAIRHPHNCEPLPDGHVMIADSDNNRAVEIDGSGRVVWTYDTGLNWPRDANRLPNGNTLIADSRNSRLVDVSSTGDIVWEYRADHFANFYEVRRLPDGNTLFSDQQHGEVVEIDTDGKRVWSISRNPMDRDYADRLQNGFFKKTDDDGWPEHWLLATRLSEGGGRRVWGADDLGRPVPGLEFDRPGALCLQQTLSVDPGAYYTMGGKIRTEELDGMACLQFAFLDHKGGLVCDASLTPRGVTLSGSSDWTEDSFEAPAPENATAVDVRVFISGKGRVYFNQIRFFA